MENLSWKEILEKRLRVFHDKDYRELVQNYMSYNPEDLKSCIRNNTILMNGIEDIAIKVKLTGELRNGLGAMFQTGLQLGFFLAIQEIEKMKKVN